MEGATKLLDYGPLGILCFFAVLALAAVVAAIVYLYKRQNEMSAAVIAQQAEVNSACEQQRDELHRKLLEAHRDYATKLGDICEKFASVVSGNLQAMEGMSENFGALREAVEKAARAKPKEHRRRA